MPLPTLFHRPCVLTAFINAILSSSGPSTHATCGGYFTRISFVMKHILLKLWLLWVVWKSCMNTGHCAYDGYRTHTPNPHTCCAHTHLEYYLAILHVILGEWAQPDLIKVVFHVLTDRYGTFPLGSDSRSLVSEWKMHPLTSFRGYYMQGDRTQSLPAAATNMSSMSIKSLCLKILFLLRCCIMIFSPHSTLPQAEQPFSDWWMLIETAWILFFYPPLLVFSVANWYCNPHKDTSCSHIQVQMYMF